MAFDLPRFRQLLDTRHLGHEVRHFESVDSTSAYAKRLAREQHASSSPGLGTPSLLIVADKQTAGYGQRGRSWESSPDQSLTFTVLLPAQATPLVTVMVGVAMIEALRALTRSDAPALKWVNDLVLYGRKLGGILVEACHQRWMAIGVGINLRDFPEQGGIGLESLCPGPEASAWTREEILAELLNRLEPWLDRLLAGEHEAIRRAWEAYSVTPGQDVRVEAPGREILGRALGIDADGALKVQTSDGETVLVTSGTVRRADGAYC